MKPFMSQVPRPYSRSPFLVSVVASFQAGSQGTVSAWAQSAKCAFRGPFVAPCVTAIRLCFHVPQIRGRETSE